MLDLHPLKNIIVNRIVSRAGGGLRVKNARYAGESALYMKKNSGGKGTHTLSNGYIIWGRKEEEGRHHVKEKK